MSKLSTCLHNALFVIADETRETFSSFSIVSNAEISPCSTIFISDSKRFFYRIKQPLMLFTLLQILVIFLCQISLKR